MNLKIDKEFETSRKVLASRREQLTQKGLGNKPLATRPLDDEEVNKLFECGYFGITNPLNLQLAMWWNITINFGYCAKNESRKLCFGDIKLCTDSQGTKYLEWDKGRGSKTRTGEKSNSRQRAFNPHAYQSGNVRIYELFCKKRPEESKMSDSPFFLQMVPKQHVSPGKPWYYNRPLGKNMLGDFLSQAALLLQTSSNTSLSKVANHSARKTSISNLLINNINPIHVSLLSGHKNTDSLKYYHTASKDQQKQMSNIVNSSSSSRATVKRPLQDITNQNQCTSSFSHQSLTLNNPRDFLGSTFYGAHMNNCVFNVITQNFPMQSTKRRRIVYSSDEE